MTEKFLLYELGKVAFVEEYGVLTELKPPTGTREKWQFLFKFELDFDNSFVQSYLAPKEIDIVAYLRENPTLFKINAEATVMVNFCETIQMIEGKDDEQLIQYKLIGSQFSKNNNKDPDSIKSKAAGYN